MSAQNYYGKGGRPSFRKPSRFSGGRPAGGRSFYGGRGNQRRRGPADERIDHSRFIKKAAETSEVAEFVPKHTFNDFDVHPYMKAAIAARGYVTPTPIQDAAIPPVLLGKDVVGIADTGTGKTGAFLIPLLNKVGMNKDEKVLVMVPTRELAVQIQEEFKGFAKHLRLFSVCVVGGASIYRQINDLRHDHNFVIGTPGRIKDLIEREALYPDEFNTVVLDEADRMLDMGFVKDMREIMAAMPKNRHTLFFSATLSRDIEKLIGDFLNDPVRISVKTGDTSANVDQDVVRVPKGENKIDVLERLLSQKDFSKVVIFGRTKFGVEKLSKALAERGFKAESIHGNKNHSQRQRALGNFKGDRSNILVATDVAARGLDIPDVTHVINYELPATYDDYVHRIGRTGRSNKKGSALTFVE
jgi:superfamily II DNA/RNA helicase